MLKARLELEGTFEEIQAALGGGQVITSNVKVDLSTLAKKADVVQAEPDTPQETAQEEPQYHPSDDEVRTELNRLGIKFRSNTSMETLRKKLSKATTETPAQTEEVATESVAVEAEVVTDAAPTMSVQDFVAALQKAVQKKVAEIGGDPSEALMPAVESIREAYCKGRKKDEIDPSEYETIARALAVYTG